MVVALGTSPVSISSASSMGKEGNGGAAGRSHCMCNEVDVVEEDEGDGADAVMDEEDDGAGDSLEDDAFLINLVGMLLRRWPSLVIIMSHNIVEDF